MTPPIPPLNPATLPDNDNIPGNHYAYCVRLNGPLFMQTGRMIAYYPAPNGPGIRFEPLTTANVAGFVASRFTGCLPRGGNPVIAVPPGAIMVSARARTRAGKASCW